jgi:putative oxidoreductase
MKLIVLLGRILFSAIFISAAFAHFSRSTIQYATAKGIPMAEISVPLTGIIAVLGGISVALGYKARWGAWLIVIFLVPVTFMMHNYWMLTEPEARMMQQSMFMKNISMLGGALMLTYFGAGPLSMDGLPNKPHL